MFLHQSVCHAARTVDVKDKNNSKNLVSSENKHNFYSADGKLFKSQNFIKSGSGSLHVSVESDSSSSNSFDKGMLNAHLSLNTSGKALSVCSSINRSGESTDMDTKAFSYQDESNPIVKEESMESIVSSKNKVILQEKRGYSYQEDHCHSTKSSALSSTGEESIDMNTKQWLTADSPSTNTNSRSMESLRQGSFITSDVHRRGTSYVEARSLESLEKDMRIMTNRYRRTISGSESIDENSELAAAAERKRGLFATTSKMPVPSHLSLMPGSYDRRMTILSPHSPMISHLSTPGSSYDGGQWQYTTQTIKTRRKKGNIVLPRLVLPGSTEFDPFAG